MKGVDFIRWLLFVGVILIALGGVTLVWGFAEEEIGFRDQDGTYYPPTGSFPENRISTVHDDLTYALALAAGFTVTDSQTIRIWNQLVDSEALPSAVISYTYGNTGFYPEPTKDSVCPGQPLVTRKIWPTNSFSSIASSTTSRFGPYSPFFHFPHRNGSDLQALRDWGWGITNTLVGYDAYIWGRNTDLTVMQAVQRNCYITRTATISMPVQAGSLPAFATYLHSLADAYSHEDCMNALAANTPPSPWGTHTVVAIGDTSIPACDYNPNAPTNTDAHGTEFGSGSATARTINAARAVYAELSARSFQRDGVFVPLPLTTTLIVSGTLTTLDGAISYFVTQWNYDRPGDRRIYADKLVLALQATPRVSTQRILLPAVSKNN